MNKIIFTLIIMLYGIKTCLAQNLSGARLTAMGNSTVAVIDHWNFTGNFKNYSQNFKPTIAIGYATYFYENELSTQNLKFILPIKSYELGINFQRYGINEFNEITTGASLAKNFGNRFSIGLRANYHQLKIENYGSTTGFSLDAGVLYHISHQLTVAFNIINPAEQKYNTSAVALQLPSIFTIGAAYQASNKILVAASLSKNFKEKFDVGLGIEYQLIPFISLRGGTTIKPFKQYGGLGIAYKKFNLDLTVANDIYLGYSSQIGIAYAF